MVSVPVTVLCLSLAFVLMVASFWAEAAVMAALTDPETGSYSSFSVSLLFVTTDYGLICKYWLWPLSGLRPQSWTPSLI
jgi:hypothetical protein